MRIIIVALMAISSLSFLSCGDSKQSSGYYPTAPKGLSEPDGIHFPTSDTPSANPIDFSVNGVRLGDWESEVVHKLRTPLKRYIKKVDYCDESEILFLEYRGVEFKLVRAEKGKFSVLEILVSAPNVRISPQIEIGDADQNVREKLGIPATEFEEEGMHYFGYYTKGSDNADLAFQGNKLLRLRLWINPC